MKTVDFHIHVYPPEIIRDAESLSLREPYFNALTHNRVHRWATLEDLLDRMERDDVERAVVDDQGEVGPARGLEARAHAGGPESCGGGDAHGATPSVTTPVVSPRPRARLRHWTAAEAVPLPRLSMAQIMVAAPAARS